MNESDNGMTPWNESDNGLTPWSNSMSVYADKVSRLLHLGHPIKYAPICFPSQFELSTV